MPKVSDEHRKAQEQRFLDAARRCFTRLGVAPASMEEIRTEAGVSAGAMYRYFASKDDLIHAAIETSLQEFETLLGRIAQRDNTATPSEYLQRVLTELRQFRFHTEGVDLFQLAIQGWAHAQAQPETKAMIVASFQRQLAHFTRAAKRGRSRADASVVGSAIGGAVLGYVVQSAFSDVDVDPDRYCAGLAMLG